MECCADHNDSRTYSQQFTTVWETSAPVMSGHLADFLDTVGRGSSLSQEPGRQWKEHGLLIDLQEFHIGQLWWEEEDHCPSFPTHPSSAATAMNECSGLWDWSREIIRHARAPIRERDSLCRRGRVKLEYPIHIRNIYSSGHHVRTDHDPATMNTTMADREVLSEHSFMHALRLGWEGVCKLFLMHLILK